MGDADIRISFEEGGNWSYIGTASQPVPQDKATMNFGGLQNGVEPQKIVQAILHEFGHALGCVHEHQRPDVNISWEEERVHEHYAKSKWSKEMVESNILKPYCSAQLSCSEYDKALIMHYPYPATLTKDGSSQAENF